MAKSKAASNTVPFYLELTGAKFDWEQYAPTFPQWEPVNPCAIKIEVPAELFENEKLTGADGKVTQVLKPEGWVWINKYMYDLHRQFVAATRIPPTKQG